MNVRAWGNKQGNDAKKKEEWDENLINIQLVLKSIIRKKNEGVREREYKNIYNKYAHKLQ